MNGTLSLCRDLFLTPCPVLYLDDKQRVSDANIAARKLLGRYLREDWPAEQGLRLNGHYPSWPNRENRAISVHTPFGHAKVQPLIVPANVLHRPPELLVFLEPLTEKVVESWRREVLEGVGKELVWEEYAISYDVIVTRMAYYEEVRDRHVRTLASAGCRHVIDIGAGTGEVAIRLADAGIRVTAVEQSRAMLHRLMAKLTESQEQRIEVLERDAERLDGLEDGAFDGVNILLVLFDMRTSAAARRVFHEAVRVLRPGGTLVITEPREKFDIDKILQLIYERFGCDSEDVTRVREANKLIAPRKDADSPAPAEVIEHWVEEEGCRLASFLPSHVDQCATLTAVKSSRVEHAKPSS
jgi:ubiquinone/menaquinone biosynthesis C-methylase UbiE